MNIQSIIIILTAVLLITSLVVTITTLKMLRDCIREMNIRAVDRECFNEWRELNKKRRV